MLQSAPMMQFQDLGRYGFMHMGVSQGGAMDLHAHCWANYLLGNDAGAVSVEVTVGNASFEALEDVEVAITGAEMNARIGDVEVAGWGVHVLRRGEVLKMGYARSGSHAYLAIRGGFCVEEVLGSGSTVVRNDIGALLGAGDALSAGGCVVGESIISKRMASDYVPDYDGIEEIRVILREGQDVGFSEAFLNTSFMVSSESDRMGRRLVAESSLPEFDGIISEGVSLGAIQLPPSGQPIVLLNDRQTQGGYAKVANVARVDLPLMAQVSPSRSVKFVPVSCEAAAEEWAEFVRFFGL